MTLDIAALRQHLTELCDTLEALQREHEQYVQKATQTIVEQEDRLIDCERAAKQRELEYQEQIRALRSALAAEVSRNSKP